MESQLTVADVEFPGDVPDGMTVTRRPQIR